MHTFAEKSNNYGNGNGEFTGLNHTMLNISCSRNSDNINLKVLHNKNANTLQPKLTINSPGDIYEKEADEMAGKVMRMENPVIDSPGVKNNQYNSVIQRKQSGNEASAESLAAVSDVINSSSGKPLDSGTRAFMEPRFGHDFSKVRIHTSEKAAVSAREINAQAYTVGNNVVFGDGQYAPGTNNGQSLLAHELTHVVQQNESLNLKIQRYVESSGERISDDGKMVVDDHTKDAWTLSSKIDDSNTILNGIRSEITLKKLGTKRKQKVPGGSSEIELEKYDVEMASTGTGGDLKKNCGRACLQVLGHNIDGEREFVAVTKNKTTSEYTPVEKYHGDDQAPGGLTSTTEELSTHIYIKIMNKKFGKTLSRLDALKEWKALDPVKKLELSKKYGINEFAIPLVGQGITMGTEFDSPGFKDDIALGRTNNTWNFHFGSPVITSGADYTTVENFTGSSHDYYFSMFGPASKSQSWYDEQKTAGFGSDHTAMVVQHPSTLLGHVNEGSTLLVKSPEIFNESNTGVLASLANGVNVTIIRKGMSWMKVTVIDGKHAGKTGWIMNKYFSQ